VNLWEEGYVDSAGVVEMIAFLETRFELTLPEEVLWDPDFTNVRGIAALVANAKGDNSRLNEGETPEP
jgi:acyl carrier protein